MHLLVVGGSDAGISAALRARELDPNASVSVLLADDYPNFSICGIPYFHGGEVPDWKMLAHRSVEELRQTGIRIFTNNEAIAIDSHSKTVTALTGDRQRVKFPYDKLVLGTGSIPIRPNIPGIDSANVFMLHTMDESRAIDRYVRDARPKSAVIIGAGYIGIEMAEAFAHQQIETTLIEALPEIMRTVDPEIGELIHAEFERRGVRVITNTTIEKIESRGDGLCLTGESFSAITDVALIAVGVRPNVSLSATAGIRTGLRGAIAVNDRMETSIADIYAAGDCVETMHRLLDRPMYLPLGTTSHKQGRVAGANAVGVTARFKGVVGTQVVKIFDRAVAGTGLTTSDATYAGFDAFAVQSEAFDHKVYYPDAVRLTIRVVGDRISGRLLGAQIEGDRHGEVAKRIDVFASAIFHGMKVEDVSDLDLSYAPPFGSPWDAVQIAAQRWVSERAIAQPAVAG